MREGGADVRSKGGLVFRLASLWDGLTGAPARLLLAKGIYTGTTEQCNATEILSVITERRTS